MDEFDLEREAKGSCTHCSSQKEAVLTVLQRKDVFLYYQLVTVYGILPIAFDILLVKSAFR